MADRYAPARLFTHLRGAIADTDTVRGFVPTIYSETVEIFRDECFRKGIPTEVVFPEPALAYFRDRFEEEFATVNGSETFSIHETTIELPFGLFVLGDPPDRVLIVVHGDSGSVRGIIDADAPDAVAWAMDLYDTHVEASSERDG